jgi:hypothetical protein
MSAQHGVPVACVCARPDKTCVSEGSYTNFEIDVQNYHPRSHPVRLLVRGSMIFGFQIVRMRSLQRTSSVSGHDPKPYLRHGLLTLFWCTLGALPPPLSATVPGSREGVF